MKSTIRCALLGLILWYGCLHASAQISLPIITGDGVALGGSGTIIGNIDNEGHWEPGQTWGALYASGPLEVTSMQVKTTPEGYSDQVFTDDTATISGKLELFPGHDLYRPQTAFSILTASNGVTGQFGEATLDDLIFLDIPVLEYGESNIVVVVHRKPFASVALTKNQKNVAKALDVIIDSVIAGESPGLSNLVDGVFGSPSAGSAQEAFNSASGEIHGTLKVADIQQHDTFVKTVTAHTGRMDAKKSQAEASRNRVRIAANGVFVPATPDTDDLPWEIWGKGYGSWGHFDSDQNARGAHYDLQGFSGGLDRTFGKVLAGFALGYSHNTVDSSGGPLSRGKVDAFQFAGYANYESGPWNWDAVLSYAHLMTETKRRLVVGSISQTLEGDYDGNIFGVSAGGSYRFALGPINVQPGVGFDYIHLCLDDFSEHNPDGDSANGLHVSELEMDSLRSSMGVRLTAPFGKRTRFIPELRVAWEHEFLDREGDYRGQFIGGGPVFNSYGVKTGVDSVVAGAGLTVAFSERVQVFVNYEARLNDRSTAQTVSGGFSVGW